MTRKKSRNPWINIEEGCSNPLRVRAHFNTIYGLYFYAIRFDKARVWSRRFLEGVSRKWQANRTTNGATSASILTVHAIHSTQGSLSVTWAGVKKMTSQPKHQRCHLGLYTYCTMYILYTQHTGQFLFTVTWVGVKNDNVVFLCERLKVFNLKVLQHLYNLFFAFYVLSLNQ